MVHPRASAAHAWSPQLSLQLRKKCHLLRLKSWLATYCRVMLFKFYLLACVHSDTPLVNIFRTLSEARFVTSSNVDCEPASCFSESPYHTSLPCATEWQEWRIPSLSSSLLGTCCQSCIMCLFLALLLLILEHIRRRLFTHAVMLKALAIFSWFSSHSLCNRLDSDAEWGMHRCSNIPLLLRPWHEKERLLRGTLSSSE